MDGLPGFRYANEYAEQFATIDSLTPTGITSVLPQSISEIDEDYKILLDTRRKLFETDTSNDLSTQDIEIPSEIIKLGKQVKEAKEAFQKLAMEYIDASESSEDAKQFKERFVQNNMVSAKLENLATNSKRLPESLREMFMQHMSILKPIEKEIVTDLDEFITTLNKKRAETSQSIKALSEMFQCVQSMSGYRSCPICLSREVSNYLVPCGHTFCTACLEKHKGACFLCRKPITTQSRLYFS